MEQTKSNITSVIFAIIIIAVIVGGGIYFWQTQTPTETAEAEQNQSTNQQVAQPQSIVYENPMYGFTLTFPQTWEGYTAKNRTLTWGPDTTDSLDFGLTAQDDLFNLSIFSPSQWKRIKSEEGPTPAYLGENSRYVFGYGTAQEVVNDEMGARMKEVQEIVETFKLKPSDPSEPVVIINQPVITYPTDGSTVDGITIKGTARPNSQIWAYINFPKNELACVSINSYANGGASTVDSKGNFEFALAEPCGKELNIAVTTEDLVADKTGACRSPENVSEQITFFNSGEQPGICNQ